MKKWLTEVKAVDKKGDMKTYGGPDVEAPSWELAQEYCEQNGLGYCKVIGELIMDGDTDYEIQQLN